MLLDAPIWKLVAADVQFCTDSTMAKNRDMQRYDKVSTTDHVVNRREVLNDSEEVTTRHGHDCLASAVVGFNIRHSKA